jgi:hypothetical protein
MMCSKSILLTPLLSINSKTRKVAINLGRATILVEAVMFIALAEERRRRAEDIVCLKKLERNGFGRASLSWNQEKCRSGSGI